MIFELAADIWRLHKERTKKGVQTLKNAVTKRIVNIIIVCMIIMMVIDMASLDSNAAFAKLKKPGKVTLVSVKMKKPSYKYQKLRVNVK